MTELIRDTVLGHLLRLVSKGKILPYEEEQDPLLWRRYIDTEKSGRMAHHGHIGEEEKTKEQDVDNGGPRRNYEDVSRGSSTTGAASHDAPRNEVSGVKIDPEKGKDVTVVTWFSEDDPENPINWSRGKKFFVTFEICLLTFSVYIGSAICSAGTLDVAAQFGVSQVTATLGLTLFGAGYGIGPMIWAPMSEIPQFGPNPVYIGTLVVFVFLQFAVIYAKNFGMLLAFRFLTGFFGSPVLATGGASLGDMYARSKRAYAIAIWGQAAVAGPTFGPVIGGFAAESKGWTWTIWELIWLSGFALFMMIFFLPETSFTNIFGREHGWRGDLMMTLIRPFSLNFTEPIFFCLNLYIALIYDLLYFWFESFVIVFVDTHDFTLGEESLSFRGIFAGTLIVISLFFLYRNHVQEPQFNENGDIKNEIRLQPAFVGAFCIPICLFWFGWSSQPDIHWIMPIIGSAFFSIGALVLFNSVLKYLGDAYPDYPASMLAGNNLMRSSFGAGFPLFASAMYYRLGVGWASSLLGVLSIAFIPIPFALYFYGGRIRKASKRARHDI